MPYFHPQRELKIPLIPFISAVCEEECATTFFDFHSESFCAALLHVQQSSCYLSASQHFDQTFTVLDWTGWTGAFSRTQQKQTSAHEAEIHLFFPPFQLFNNSALISGAIGRDLPPSFVFQQLHCAANPP